MIRYSYKNELKFVPPIFLLERRHNNGKLIETNLSNYYDLSNITIDNEHFKLYSNNNYNEILEMISTHHLIR